MIEPFNPPVMEEKKPRKKTYKYKDVFEGEIPKKKQNKPIKPTKKKS
jgi:hypothetical protein